MNEAEFLNKLRSQAERDSYFYSNKGRAEREIWAVSEFLNGIGASHSKEELICQQQDSKIDVKYNGCSFQLKEITDPDERRGKYYKDTCNMLRQASALSEVEYEKELKDIPEVTRSYNLIAQYVEALSAQARYMPVKSQLDLLIYVTRTRSAPVDVSEVDAAVLLRLGWRSISFFNSKQYMVLCAAKNAPSILSEKALRVKIC